jgi:hypothetical protein
MLALRARSDTAGFAGNHDQEGVRSQEIEFRMEKVFALNQF